MILINLLLICFPDFDVALIQRRVHLMVSSLMNAAERLEFQSRLNWFVLHSAAVHVALSKVLKLECASLKS